MNSEALEAFNFRESAALVAWGEGRRLANTHICMFEWAGDHSMCCQRSMALFLIVSKMRNKASLTGVDWNAVAKALNEAGDQTLAANQERRQPRAVPPLGWRWEQQHRHLQRSVLQMFVCVLVLLVSANLCRFDTSALEIAGGNPGSGCTRRSLPVLPRTAQHWLNCAP